MSEPAQHTQCPLSNPLNCKEYNNPQVCAFVREDKTCTKKKKARNQSDDTGTDD